MPLEDTEITKVVDDLQRFRRASRAVMLTAFQIFPRVEGHGLIVVNVLPRIPTMLFAYLQKQLLGGFVLFLGGGFDPMKRRFTITGTSPSDP